MTFASTVADFGVHSSLTRTSLTTMIPLCVSAHETEQRFQIVPRQASTSASDETARRRRR